MNEREISCLIYFLDNLYYREDAINTKVEIFLRKPIPPSAELLEGIYGIRDGLEKKMSLLEIAEQMMNSTNINLQNVGWHVKKSVTNRQCGYSPLPRKKPNCCDYFPYCSRNPELRPRGK